MTQTENPEAGFSLLEALVALSILAIAAAALIGASEAHIDRIAGLEDRAIASWVADEQLTELRLARALPSSSSKTRDMAGQQWRVDITATATDDPELIRADIAVHSPDKRDIQARLSGFIDTGGGK